MRSLWRDRRAAFGVAVLAIVTGAAVAGPLVSSGSPTAQQDVVATRFLRPLATDHSGSFHPLGTDRFGRDVWTRLVRSEEHTSELQSLTNLVCRLLLEKK